MSCLSKIVALAMLYASVALAETPFFDNGVDVLFVRPMNISNCESWQSRMERDGFQSIETAEFAGLARCADVVHSKSVMIAVRESSESEGKISTEGSKFYIWSKSSSIPDEITSMEDVVNLVANFNSVTTKAIRMVVPPNRDGNAPTLKIHRFNLPRGPVDGGNVSSFMGLLMEVKFK